MRSLPKEVEIVLAKLRENGFEAYPVGGCVRDLLLGKAPNDWDITTSAKPEQTLAVFEEYKTLTNGIKHGTVGVICRGKMMEITTFRVDGDYEDHRHPTSVVYTTSLEQDLSRRDFTVNAMALDERGLVHDPFGGVDDLCARLIKCVGDPLKRFDEDALRILRGLRFASMEGFTLDEPTREAACIRADFLSSIAAERKLTELKKMFALPGAPDVMRKTYPVFKAVFPTLTLSESEWPTLCESIRRTKQSVAVSLGCIFAHVNIQEEIERLKPDKYLKKGFLAMQAIQPEDLAQGKAALRQLMAAHTRECVLYVCDVYLAEERIPESVRQEALAVAAGCVTMKEMAVSGHDLLDAGCKSHLLRTVLEKLFAAVSAGECKNDREALLALYNTWPEAAPAATDAAKKRRKRKKRWGKKKPAVEASQAKETPKTEEAKS